LQTKDIDERTAIFLAAVCSQTYVQYIHMDGHFVTPEFHEVAATIHAKSLVGKWERFGFILQSEDRNIVAFRGTSSTTDWISDAIATQGKYKCVPGVGLSHRGISDIYYSTRGQILTALSKLPKDKPLLITGHSLGGALAALCAVDVADNSAFNHPSVYTYGAPRVGDPTFAKAFSSKVDQSFRIHNRFDIVPQLPPHVYKLPKRSTTYHYMHVRDAVTLQFHNGSVLANHLIGSYFTELAKREPQYTDLLSLRNPGFCPELVKESSQPEEYSLEK
jgi:triacylglycerol lipase